MKSYQLKKHLSNKYEQLKELFLKNKVWGYCIIAVLIIIVVSILFLVVNFNNVVKNDHDEHGHGETEQENELVISEIAQELAGLKLDKASVNKIQATVSLYGRIFPNQNKLAQIVSSYPGIVRKVHKTLGDSVKAGEILASIEANGSLSVFPIKSKISGTVIKKEIVPGEFVSNKEVLFEVTDLLTVWVNLNITEQDFDKVKKNQRVFIKMWDHDQTIEAEISYISSIIHSVSQTLLARTEIDNSSGLWRPGSFVTAEVNIEEKKSVTVNANAIQIINEKPVVFVRKEEDLFVVREVIIGIRGRDTVEIIDGIKDGEFYVSKKSFALKAEFLKSLAGHDHGH